MSNDLIEHLSFDPQFAFEIALQHEPVQLVMERHGVDIETLKKLKDHRPFQLAVANFKKEIKENGITFKTKAKLLAEDLLGEAYLMAKNGAVPASVRMDGIKNIVRWAELEPKKNSEETGTNNQFNIQINL